MSTKDEGSLQNSIDIYPNPFQEVLHIFSKYSLEDAIFILHDSRGQILWMKDNLSGQNLSILLPYMEEGIYSISIINPKGSRQSIISKLVIMNR